MLFVLATPDVFSFGRKEKVSDSQNTQINNVEAAETANQPDTGQENTIKILGRIRIYGSEPRTYAGIVDENGTAYAIYPPSAEDELRRLQGHIIEFSVIVLDEPQGYGSLFLRGGTVTPLSWEIKQ